jgi:tetratricopeptide (TPR) repeat protein
MTDRERLLSVVQAKAAERFCRRCLDRTIRVAWLSGVLKLMEGSPYATIGDFLATPQGAKFKRRARWALRSAGIVVSPADPNRRPVGDPGFRPVGDPSLEEARHMSTPWDEANDELQLGNESFSFGLSEESEQHFLRSIHLHETPIANYSLGVLYHVIGREAEAIESYRRALVLDADYLPARENLQLLGAIDGSV